MVMSNEDAYTPDDTPACPFCGSEKTLQVRPESARCLNTDCRYVRFPLEPIEADDDNDYSDAFDEIAEIMDEDRTVIEEMAEVAFSQSEQDGGNDG